MFPGAILAEECWEMQVAQRFYPRCPGSTLAPDLLLLRPSGGKLRKLCRTRRGIGTMDSKKILVVEDNADNREIISLVLRHRGYAVLEAEDAETALELVSDERPDLVLMDISLPRMDGFQATARLREMPHTSRVPVIAVSAHAFMEEKRAAEEVGFDSYLTKPVAPSRIVEEVDRFLGRAA